jgi:short-subunit dehydrogenase
VANAGVGVFTPAKRLDAALVERVMRVNFLGLVYAVEAVLPGMLERRAGHIVGVSSLAGWRGFPKTSAYAASKAAMTSWLEGLRIELAHQGVRVTTVHPGFVRTPMTAPNPFRMPFLMEADVAARIIARGVERGRSEVNFPFPTAGFMHVMRRMPNFVYDLLMRKGM